MADFRGYVTAAGQTFEALAKQMGYPVTIGFIEVGDGKLPDSESPIDRTHLVHKLKQFPAIVEQDAKNPGQWVATCYIPADDAINGAGYFIREIGCKLINQGDGVLYAYRRVSDDWKPVITSGEAKSFIYKLRFIPSNGELLTPTIDPSIVLVDKEELARVMKAHVDSIDHPYANSLWKRSLADAGYELIGRFGAALTITNECQAVIDKDGKEAYSWNGVFPKNIGEHSTPDNSGGIGDDAWNIITLDTLRDDIKKLDGSLGDKAEWSNIPLHSAKDLSYALNAQAKALANRTTLLREKCTLSIHAEDFRKDQEGVVRSDADTLIAALDFVVSQSNMVLPYEGELSNGISIDLGGRKYACHKVVKQTGGLKYGNVVFTNGCITWAPPLAAQAKVIEIGQQAGYVYQANFENVTFLQCQLNYRSALSSWVHASCTFINCVDPIKVDDGCHEIYVNGNLFRLTTDRGGNKGIVFPADCRADGNVFVGYDIAIHLTKPSNIVSGNHFYGTRVGVKEDYSAGQNQIVFNQFDGCTLESDNSCGMGIISHNIFYAQSVYYAVLVKPKPGFSSHVSSRITNNTFNFYNTPDLTPKIGGSVTVLGNTVKAGDFEFKEKMVGAAIFSADGNGTFIHLGVIVNYVDSKTVTISKVKGLADGVHSVGVQPNAVCYHTEELPDPTFIPEFVIRDNNISNGVAINTGSILGRELSYNPALDHFQLIGKGIETNAYKAFKANNVSAYSQFANIPDDTAFRAATSDGSGTWAAFGYDPTDNGGDGCFILRGGKSGNGGRYRGSALGFTPGNDNARTLGSATNRWSSVYASTGTINTSDVREKEIAEEFDDAVLDAWSEVRLIQYKWKSAINDKGTDARIHFGVGAQEVYAAFEKHGLNPFSYGVLCYDKWDESPAVYDEQGNEVTPAREAGDRWGVRADECAFLEMALQRRNYTRLLERIGNLGV